MSNESRLGAAEEMAKSAHKRIDEFKVSVETELKGLRDAKHDIYEKIHTHAGIMVGMQGAVERLTTSVDTWSDKTDKNTEKIDKNTKIIDRASWVIVGGVTVGGVLLSGILYLLNQFLALL